MASNRPTKETAYLRREFTADERIEMGRELAQAHNRIAAVDDEEKAMKTQIKERRAGIELSIGTLSRKLNDGYEMENIPCTLTWDDPNVGEVTSRDPSGKIVKTRPMTAAERQEELNFDESTSTPAPASVEESAANIAEFFDNTGNAAKVGGEPSAEDLDAVAEDKKAAEATGSDVPNTAAEDSF